MRKNFDHVLEDLISLLGPPALVYPLHQKVQVQDGLSDPQPPSFPGISAGFPTTFSCQNPTTQPLPTL
jgi:hypothetical protein